jgi:peptide subunit release factor RF-3
MADLIAGAGALAINKIQSDDARSAANKQITQQTKEEQDLINQEKAKTEEQKKVAGKITKRNFDEGLLNTGKFDANKTLFTGPLGSPTPLNTGGKSLLGQ